MKKIILLIILIGAAVWYFDLSRKMTEASIHESYQAQVDALQRFDARPLCDALDSDYTAHITLRGSSSSAKTRNKIDACSELTRSLRRMKILSDRTAGLVAMDYDLDIESIKLSANRKMATVELDAVARLGDMVLSRTHSVEHLIRRNGRIMRTDSDDSVWVYRPD